MSPLLVSGGCAIVLLVAGGLATPIGHWYRALRKPAWQPPNWLFGPAWTVILGLAAWSAAIAWSAAPTMRRATPSSSSSRSTPPAISLWSPLFFRAAPARLGAGRGRVPMGVAGRADRRSVADLALRGLLILPYFLWVSFAAVLNLTIVRLNRPFG